MGWLPGPEPEGMRRGMNDRESPKKLGEGVGQLLVNGYPGLTVKPRNGLTDKVGQSSPLGYHSCGGATDSLYRPSVCYYAAGGKRFVLCWAQSTADLKEYHLETFDLDLNARDRIVQLAMPVEDVGISMKVIYDSVYVSFEYEATQNRTHAGRVKSFILKYVSGAWTVRDSLLDVSPVVAATGVDKASDYLGVFPINNDYDNSPSETHALSYNGYIWVLRRDRVVRSVDGLEWETVTVSPGYQWGTALCPCSAVVFRNRMWLFTPAAVGGVTGKVYYSTDGIVWTIQNADFNGAAADFYTVCAVDDHVLLFTDFDDKVYSYGYRDSGGLWMIPVEVNSGTGWGNISHLKAAYANGIVIVTGGIDNNTGFSTEAVWVSSDGGVTFVALVAGLAQATARHGIASSGQDVVVFGGEDIQVGGITFLDDCAVGHIDDAGAVVFSTPSGGSAIVGARIDLAVVYHNEKWYVIGGHTQTLTYEYEEVWEGVVSTTPGSAVAVWTKLACTIDSERPDPLYSEYAGTFVLREDSGVTLASYSAYPFSDNAWHKPFEPISGWARKIFVSGAWKLEGIRGSTVFLTELEVGDKVSNDGGETEDAVTAVTNDLNAAISGSNVENDLFSRTWMVCKQDDIKPGIDEELLTGLVAVSGTALTGTGTQFQTEVIVGDRLRLDGVNVLLQVKTITNDTAIVLEANATALALANVRAARVPAVGSAISTSLFSAGVAEGEHDADLNVAVSVVGYGDHFECLVSVTNYTDALARGMTHLRVYRSLPNADATIAPNLSKRYVADILLASIQAGGAFTDSANLEGESNVLEVTGYSPAPNGRYNFYDNTRSLMWIFGDPANEGYAYHSASPGSVANPQKYLSWFNPTTNFISVNPQDGQKGTGVQSLAGDLYFFKERSIYVLNNGNPNGVPRRISATVGCAYPQTLIAADIPRLGGQCLLFLSEYGPCILTAGGSIRLLDEFTVNALWRGGELVENADGTATDWYSRNKVHMVFWQNTIWVFYGDSRDTACDYTTNKIYGFHFGDERNSYGPFKLEINEVTNSCNVEVVVNEPLCLVAVNGVEAYSLSHCIDEGYAKRYRLTRFLDSTSFVDTFKTSTTDLVVNYDMVAKTRYLYSGPTKRHRSLLKKVEAFIGFADILGLSFRVTADAARFIVPAPYTEERQSGRSAVGADDYRHHVALHMRNDVHGDFFDVETTKVVPPTGDIEYEGVMLEVEGIDHEDEFTSGY